MNTQNVLSLIETVLKNMTAQAERLAQVISEEGHALREASIETLNAKVQSKQEIIIELTQFDQQFRVTLEKLGYNNQQDIALFLKSIQVTNPIQDLWNEYLSLLEQCHAKNHHNSSLVSIGMRHTSRALEFLHSCVGEYNEQVYGPKGQKVSDNNQKIIAKA